MRRFILGITLMAALIGAVALYWVTRPLPVLTVTTWPGAYGHAQRATLIEPYRDVARVNMHANEWEGDLKELSRAIASHSYKGTSSTSSFPRQSKPAAWAFWRRSMPPACRQGSTARPRPTTL